MQPHAEFAVQLPWIRMEYNQLRCVSNEGKKKGSARAVSQVGEKLHKSQDRQSEGFRIIRGKAQCNALRSFRRIFPPPIHLQIVAERSYDRRMGWNDEAECVNPPADKKMEMDVDEEPQTQTNSSVYSRSSANHRCIRKLLGSNPQTKQNVTRLSQSFSIRGEKPIIQLQRTKSCGTCPYTFCTNPSRESDFTVATSFRQLSSCFQREQKECRKESPSNTQKDMDIEGETEDSPESSSSPRIAKHKSRCFVPPGKSRRLRHCRQRAQRNLVSSSSYSNAGRLCSSTQPQGRSLVRNWKPIGRRRSSISMEERVRSGTPPSSPDSNDDSEGTEGESTSSITPAELEGAGLGCAIGEDASSDIQMEESENSTEKGSINGKHRCMSSSRPVKSHIHQSTRVKGESWWRRALEERSFQVSLAEECISGIAQSTWDGYLFGFAHFGEQWEKSDMGIIPEDIHEWAARCSSMFITLRDNGMKLSLKGIRRLANKRLKEAGIPGHFTPYSIKAATLSTLTMSGIPPTQIAKFVRLSPRTDTLVKHYVKANLASTLGKVIVSTMNVPSEELANNPCAENGVKKCVRPDRDQKNKKERREMESGMVLRDKKRLMKPGLSEEEAKDTVEFPSRVDEPDEEMEEQKSLGEQFIIRTRSQAKKEEESNNAKKTHTVVVMMASSSN
ncbi:uncharacterized protein MONOS_4560 [Monocercomonoides exilis]|uniref:uncharacterized protein n=1 Tax=Monocercomonoides exilis TaxID=2049356 RepID=UPI0035599E13|nr:hypothetical protein MONOS_4560 [Monocercomonoides exilis]|eukprot:MONOS_4560.1-p1 / transcript=MONOS_4560.1 / gene=MONOS_4560 / organism=Monocercomonoides_exilis_PA203 / gene_product=unspecified product / transcript_product=unspecified product / location=Mono_scaffold00122:72889-75405(+) / protein_length=673 / sequence_SO=supercontig / SO=protein_coding / is_pseudo=false